MGTSEAAINGAVELLKLVLERVPFGGIVRGLTLLSGFAIFVPARYQGAIYGPTHTHFEIVVFVFLLCGMLSIVLEVDWWKQKKVLNDLGNDEKDTLRKFTDAKSLTQPFQEGDLGPASLLTDRILYRAVDSHKHGAPSGFFYYHLNRRAYWYLRRNPTLMTV